jgi:hypothetical protein
MDPSVPRDRNTARRRIGRIHRPLLLALLAGCTLLCVASLGVFYIWQAAREAQIDAVRTELVQLARVAAREVDGDRHRTITSQAQAGSPAHLALLYPLLKFHKATTDIYYVYTAVLIDNRINLILGTDNL